MFQVYHGLGDSVVIPDQSDLTDLQLDICYLSELAQKTQCSIILLECIY